MPTSRERAFDSEKLADAALALVIFAAGGALAAIMSFWALLQCADSFGTPWTIGVIGRSSLWGGFAALFFFRSLFLGRSEARSSRWRLAPWILLPVAAVHVAAAGVGPLAAGSAESFGIAEALRTAIGESGSWGRRPATLLLAASAFAGFLAAVAHAARFDRMSRAAEILAPVSDP